MFHDGSPVTSEVVRNILVEQLPLYLGPAFDDIRDIRIVDDNSLEIVLNRPSAFLVEGLEAPVGRPGNPTIGTGPFYVAAKEDNVVQLKRNDGYHEGAPVIGRITIRPYASIRSAWADMLRGQVDMLYEVGLDALDSLQPSNEAKVFAYQRNYAYLVLLNVQRPQLRNAKIRRMLNAAIDRAALVSEALKGHGRPADGPVWPSHWAYSQSLPKFQYDPRPIEGSQKADFTCLIGDASLEHLALTVQKQLQTVGVTMRLELIPVDELLLRIKAGGFDAIFADALNGPNLLRPYQFWHTGSPNNWGRFSSAPVDASLDAIRHAEDDKAYETGVAAFQRAIVDDPPAIFLAWSERARAVSTRFEVPVEPGRDIVGTLRLWRPLADPRVRSTN